MNQLKFPYLNLLHVYCLIFVVLAACEKKTDLKLDIQSDDRIVVDGMITNEKKTHMVTISMPITELNAIATPVTGAIVTIDDGDSTFILNEIPVGSGIYQTSATVSGVPGKQYLLNINYGGKNYSASDSLVSITQFDPFSIKPAGNSLYVLKSANKPYGEEAAMWQVLLDWSGVPGYTALDSSLTHAKLAFYNFNSIDVSQVFSPKKETVLFPNGTMIIKNQYSLSKEYSDFLRALVSETEWQGGYFDVSPANPPTNFNDGAIGFFSASAVLTDTIIVTQ